MDEDGGVERVEVLDKGPALFDSWTTTRKKNM